MATSVERPSRQTQIQMGSLVLSSALLLLAHTCQAARSTTTERCPGIKTCIQIAVDPILADGEVHEGDVSTATDVTVCQDSCISSQHYYYQFQPSTSLCICFSKCIGVKAGQYSVGAVKACRAGLPVFKEDVAPTTEAAPKVVQVAPQETKRKTAANVPKPSTVLERMASVVMNPLARLEAMSTAATQDDDTFVLQAVQASENGLSLLH